MDRKNQEPGKTSETRVLDVLDLFKDIESD